MKITRRQLREMIQGQLSEDPMPTGKTIVSTGGEGRGPGPGPPHARQAPAMWSSCVKKLKKRGII